MTQSSKSPTPWSNRFEEGLNPFIVQFNASIPFDIQLIEYDITGSVAHAKMLCQVGIINQVDADLIEMGLEQIRRDWRAGQFNPGIDAEDVHYAVERKLIELIGDTGKKLHTGRSRNDQVATDLRLYLRKQIEDIIEQLRGFQGTLIEIAKRNVETLIPGYTHLQRAQPVSLAHHLLAYFEMAQRDVERLTQLRTRVNISPLGSGALAGTTLPINRQYSAELLGFDGVSENSLDGVSDRDYLVEFHSASSLILMHLSKLSEEVILWASQEFGFVSLTDRCATGSSLMPQKKNPDVPELVRGKTGRVFGNLIGLLTALKGLPLAYNKDLQEDKEALFDSVSTVKQCLEAMTILMQEGIIFNQERLALAVTEDFSNATDAADFLVQKGVPFRQAYGVIGGIVKHCIGAGTLLKDLTVREWQGFHPAFDADIYSAIEARTVVSARNSYGGTGFDQVRAALLRAELRMQGE